MKLNDEAQNKEEGPANRQKNVLLIGFVVGFVLIACGTAWVILNFIDSLQETSHKVQMAKVKPRLELQDQFATTVDGLYDKFETRNDAAEASYERAVALVKRHDCRSAITFYQQSLGMLRKDLKGKAPDYFAKTNIGMRLQGIADCYLKLKQYDDCVRVSSENIELNPLSPAAWRTRSVAYDALNKPDLANLDLAKFEELHATQARNPALIE